MKEIKKRIDLLKKVMNDSQFHQFIDECVKNIRLEDGNFYFAGNGGSQAEASHFVGELIGRFDKDRRPYPAYNLCDPSVLTCIANDYGFENVFSRQLEPAKQTDSLFIFSTSGKSPNVVKAVKKAYDKGMYSFVFTGKDGGEADQYAMYSYVVPSNETALIQEVHQMMIHMICERLEP